MKPMRRCSAIRLAHLEPREIICWITFCLKFHETDVYSDVVVVDA
jgi:hypothetical protein